MDNTLLMDNTLWAPLTYLLEVSWSCVFGTPPLGTAFAAVRRRPSSLLSEIGDANDRTRPGRLLLLLSSPSFDRLGILRRRRRRHRKNRVIVSNRNGRIPSKITKERIGPRFARGASSKRFWPRSYHATMREEAKDFSVR